MSQKRKRSEEDSHTSATDADIFRSEPIEDRVSTFIGYFSPSVAPIELQRLPEIKDASHKILAWRKPGKQQTLTAGRTQFEIGHDDDGEKYGGKKVEQVLESMQIAGCCVVARYWGGVLLGPIRFTHIETSAREAVRKWQEHEAEESRKKREAEQEDLEKEKLVNTLLERDQSIHVLRTLASEKEAEAKEAMVAGVNALLANGSKAGFATECRDEAPATNVKTQDAKQIPKLSINYSSMSPESLRALDKARDATLGFLLKRIDKAEANLNAVKEPKEPP